MYYSLSSSHHFTLIKSPLVVGTQWVDIAPDGEIVDTLEIVSLNESVTVQAGSFTDCLKIRSFKGEDIDFIWYAPDVGFIKIGSTTNCESECNNKELVTLTIQ